MFNLIVSNQLSSSGSGTVDMPTDRFLEYTDDALTEILRSLSVEAQECMMSWPCVLMLEGRGSSPAYIGQLGAITAMSSAVRVTFTPSPITPHLTNEALWKSRELLGIEQFEFNRHHWAIKDVQLLPVLAGSGHAVEGTATSRLVEKPLPSASRAQLLAVRDVIARWPHTDIDDFLLEAGVKALRATRDVGSKRDRAIAIVTFAINNPGAKTAENSLFSSFLLRKTSSQHGAETAEPSHLDSSDNANTQLAGVMGQRATPLAARAVGVPNRVFVVHGRNEAARQAVVALLSEVGLEAVVLHEQPNMGRHLLTKLIEEAELVAFAIVVMTNDDVGGMNAADLSPRARQNVILELGYFLAHLGQKRVCAIVTPDLETPSDFDGIVYVPMDGSGSWRSILVRELRAVGMPLVDH